MDMYYEFGPDYTTVFRLLARSDLRDVAAQFVAIDIVAQREQLAQNMTASLQTTFSTLQSGEALEITQVFIKELNLPDSFNTAIQETGVAEQDVRQPRPPVKLGNGNEAPSPSVSSLSVLGRRGTGR